MLTTTALLYHPRLTALFIAISMHWAFAARGADRRSSDPPKRPIPDANILVQFRIDSDRNPILVPVLVAGNSYAFILDTGAPDVTYDRSLRKYLGPARGTESRANLIGTTVYERCDPIDAFIGCLNIRSDATVGCTDLSQLRDEGVDAHGVVGMDALKKCVLKLDPDNRIATLMKSVAPNSGRAVRIGTTRSLPSVTTYIDGYGEATFIIDTGCTGPIDAAIGWDLYRSLRAKNVMGRTSATTAQNVLGQIPTNVGSISRLSFAGFRNPELRFFCHQGAAPSFLGLSFLSRYVVTLDFANSMLYLKQSRQFAERIDDNPAGIHLGRGWAETIVEAIESEGVASRAGLQVADTVLSINGIDASKASLFDLRTALRARGTTIRIVAARSLEQFIVKFQIPTESAKKLENESEAKARGKGSRAEKGQGKLDGGKLRNLNGTRNLNGNLNGTGPGTGPID